MFTRIAKVMSIIFAIITFILAVIMYVVTDENELVFLVVLVLGGIALFNFELFVELANNVKDIKELLKENTATIKSIDKKYIVTTKETNDTKRETSGSAIDVKL